MFRKSAIALACLALGTAGAAGAACQRHIYNKSSSPWTFQANASTGNVHFGVGIICPHQVNGPCTIPAKHTVTIEYTTTAGIAKGTMSIRDHRGQSRQFDYQGLASNCPSISHHGNTGAVAVNDPANGDWDAWGDDWSAAAAARRR
jgi:hypothetical protein